VIKNQYNRNAVKCKTEGIDGVYDKNMGRFDKSFYLAYNLNA
jgi:hypothetical protein